MRETLLEDGFEGSRVGSAAGEAIRDGGARGGFDDFALLETARVRRGLRGHDADDLRGEAEGVARGGDAADGRAQTDLDVDDVERRRSLETTPRHRWRLPITRCSWKDSTKAKPR